ncbi:nitrogenase molybdenum-iron protein subunit beta [Ethanoligenens sp.]|uniref:nitrogenase molybdenum-iron protein subunit beta n=1 Tax=Ethanoligenens sp. TaxID=2099655 RepID=UPI0039E7B6C4
MLDATPKKIYEREALRINPAKTCQPVGAMYAALGVHSCLPHSHGSQGCCSYHRTLLTRHFKEPAMATTSSFTEGSSVFGGGSNLKTAIRNIFEIYKPQIIAIHTTCLSETIGDDVRTYVTQITIPEDRYVVYTHTPSYVGSHITGYANMIHGFFDCLAENTGVKNGKALLIPGYVDPGDMREIKRITKLMGVPFTMMPDTSGVFDAPTTGKYDMFPRGGTKVEDIIDAGNCDHTFAFGYFATEHPASFLEKKCKVPYTQIGLPIGLEATDRFVTELMQYSQNEVPYELEEERGQLVDLLIDAHPHFDGKKVAIFGDPDTVIGLAEFTASIGMVPRFCVTGTPGNHFSHSMKAIADKYNTDIKYKQFGDLFELHQWIKNEPVDLLMGGTHGKYIARAEDLPFVRIGFPILDRYGHQYTSMVGYKGAINVMMKIIDTLLDRKDRDAADEDLELVL